MPELTKLITTKSDNYRIDYEELLGDGAFAKVYSAFAAKRKQIVAVKIVNKDELSVKHKANVKNEVRILRSLNHPNVIKFLDVYDETKLFYIFTTKMTTDMLEAILASPRSKLDERMTRFLTMQILTAVEYLHSKDIAHCDLKPENVLLDNQLKNTSLPKIEICDFGYARSMSASAVRKSVKGTAFYSSPELLLTEKHDRSIDIWSIGVIIFVALSGTFPFDGNEATDIAADIRRKLKKQNLLYRTVFFTDVSEDAMKVMKLIISPDYTGLTVEEVMKQHWFQDRFLKQDLKALQERLKIKIYSEKIK